MLDVATPPAEYVEVYKGPLFILQLPLHRVGIVCRMTGIDKDPTVQVDGCTLLKEIGGCLAIVPKVERQITSDDVNRVSCTRLPIAPAGGTTSREAVPFPPGACAGLAPAEPPQSSSLLS